MNKRTDIDNLVFDLGNVLFTFQPLDWLKKIYPEPLAKQVNAAVFDSPHWAEVDRGVLTMDEVIARMLFDAPDMAEWITPAISEYLNMVQPIPENVALLPRLKSSGYRLYVLSNFGAAFFAETRACNPFLEQCFDGLLISGEVHIVKPETAIYLLLAHTFHLDPARTLFIDDRQENIDSARSVGIRGMCYTRHEQFFELFA